MQTSTDGLGITPSPGQHSLVRLVADFPAVTVGVHGATRGKVSGNRTSVDGHFRGVEEFASRQRLVVSDTAQFKDLLTAEGLRAMNGPDRVGPFVEDRTKVFKRPGRGRQRAVLAVTHPYLPDTPEVREAAEWLANAAGLLLRSNGPGDRLRFAGDEIVAVFWRPDLHTFRDSSTDD